MSKRRRGF